MSWQGKLSVQIEKFAKNNRLNFEEMITFFSSSLSLALAQQGKTKEEVRLYFNMLIELYDKAQKMVEDSK